jgi:hypothetical protein
MNIEFEELALDQYDEWDEINKKLRARLKL